MDDFIASLAVKYKPLMLQVAFSYTKNETDAEDVVQDSFLYMLTRLKKAIHIRNERNFVWQTVKNAAIDRIRRQAARVVIIPGMEHFLESLASQDLPADERLIETEACERILDSFQHLPAKERKVLELAAFEGYKSVQIAKRLRITDSAARARLYRARVEAEKLLADTQAGRAA